MITLKEAQALIRFKVRKNGIVKVDADNALGLALAKPIIASSSSPRFDTSSMDGYAVAVSDLLQNNELSLPLAGDIPAGNSPRVKLKPGTALRISTGAPVPTGADAIVMREHTEVVHSHVAFRHTPKPGDNIRKLGDEFKKGDIILPTDTIMTPAALGLLTSQGKKHVYVYRRPSVSLVITGSEVVLSKAKDGQISDSNSATLKACLTLLGIRDIKTYHVHDDPRETERALSNAIQRADFTIITGGISVGEHDHVKQALAKNGVKEIFWRVKIKPGKPAYFGTWHAKGQRHQKYIFALPGNPVSAMITYYLFARDAILRSMGYEQESLTLQAKLTMEVRKEMDRVEFARAYLSKDANGQLLAIPIPERESYMLSGMARANCLVVLPEGQRHLSAGSAVDVIPMQWSNL